MKVAVCLITHNAGHFLRKCIISVLNQTYKEFRLVIVDDGSMDNTQHIIQDFGDKRIHYKRNSRQLGIAASRNECIEQLKDEEYIYFTDADCCVEPDWIENGLAFFEKDRNVICVNGKTIYVCEGYRPHLFEKSHIQTDNWSEAYQTCNIAYKRIVFQKVRGFDERNFNYFLEDTDFAIRAKTEFPNMKFVSTDKVKVIHQKVEFTVSGFFSDTRKVLYIIRLLKTYGKNNDMIRFAFSGNILNKNYLLLSLFPPGIIYYIVKTKKRVSCLRDLLFVFLYVVKSYYYRVLVWKYGIKERVLIL